MQTRNPIKDKLKEIDVVILCGGMGSRLASVVDDCPKPMAQINNRPFLDILIEYFAKFGFARFILCAGHMSQVIQNYYKCKDSPLEFVISNEYIPLGTAGSVKNAEKFINTDPFLVTNGDSFCPVDLAEFYEFHSAKQSLLSMVAVESESTDDCGSVTVDDSQRIVSFEEKKQKNQKSCVNAGIYLFRKKILSLIPDEIKFSLEYDLFPGLANRDSYAFLSGEKLIDIGTPQRYEQAKKYFAAKSKVSSVR